VDWSHLSAHTVLAAYLVLLKHAPQSLPRTPLTDVWIDYVDVLPVDFDTMPVTYPPELLALLPPNIQGNTFFVYSSV
jgi:hypothetical protein